MSKRILNFKAFLLFFTPCCMTITLAFNFLSTRTESTSIYLTSTGNVSDKYATPFTPSGWTFIIWSVIYFFQILIALYMMICFCIKVDEQALYTFDNVFPLPFLIIYSINLILNLAWIFIFDRSYANINLLPLSVFILLSVSITLYVCIGIISYHIKNALENGFYDNKLAMLIIDYIVLLNGLGIYAGWTSVAQCLNLSISLIHYSNVDLYISADVGLSVLLIVVIGYVIIDLTILDKYTRYLIIPHFVVAYAVGGSINKNFTRGDYHKCFAIVEAVAVFGIIMKLGYTIGRSVKKPIVSQGSMSSQKV